MLRRPGMAGQLGQEGTVDSLSKNGGKWEQYREVTENEQVLGLEEMIEHILKTIQCNHRYFLQNFQDHKLALAQFP